MKNYNIYIISILLVIGISSFLFGQPNETVSVGEITFNDDLINSGQYNKVYLLKPGRHVVVKNYCSEEEIAIGFKCFLDVSNKLALKYQTRDSLSLNIITEYEKLDETIGNVSSDLTMLSDNLKKVSDLNLNPSIVLLDDSNKKLENSNRQLDNALVKLDEINSDLSKIQISNIWKNIIYVLGGIAVGFGAGAIVFN